MNLGRSGPRSKNGCWTCRSRKVKCDELRPVCQKCSDREIECDYAPRLKPQRRHRRVPSEAVRHTSPTQYSTPSTQLSAASSKSTPITVSSLGRDDSSFQLPWDMQLQEWPFELTAIDCRGVRHFAEVCIPRYVLRTPRWSSYSFLLFLCTKHELLAHLILAFSIRDMSENTGDDLRILAIEHYRIALAMFIEHIGSSEQALWLTFPALWLFIHYEQNYGDDPGALQRHLEGVRDVVAAHGTVLLPSSTGDFATMNMAGEERPRQIIDRLSLWTIYHDASASTFGLSGGLIELLNEQYPSAIARIRESSKSMIGAAWGPRYPPEEELWDLRLSPVESLYHDCHLLRYELSRFHSEDLQFNDAKVIEIGRALKRLEREWASLLALGIACKVEKGSIQSNNCIAAALFYAVTAIYERIVWNSYPALAISKILQCCASVYEREDIGYMWRVAWPMFVAGLETEDLIYQTWVIEKFRSMQAGGENLRRARIALETLCAEQRRTGKRIDPLERIRNGQLQGFVI